MRFPSKKRIASGIVHWLLVDYQITFKITRWLPYYLQDYSLITRLPSRLLVDYQIILRLLLNFTEITDCFARFRDYFEDYWDYGKITGLLLRLCSRCTRFFQVVYPSNGVTRSNNMNFSRNVDSNKLGESKQKLNSENRQEINLNKNRNSEWHDDGFQKIKTKATKKLSVTILGVSMIKELNLTCWEKNWEIKTVDYTSIPSVAQQQNKWNTTPNHQWILIQTSLYFILGQIRLV